MPGNPPESEWYSTPDSKRKKPRLTVTVDRELLDKLKAQAERQGIKLSELVNAILTDGVDRI